MSDAQLDLTDATWAVSVDFANGGAWLLLTGAAGVRHRATRSVVLRSCSTAKCSPVRRSAQRVGCQVGIQGGSTVITGQFTESDARELALLIRSVRCRSRWKSSRRTRWDRPWAPPRSMRLWAAIGSLLTVLFLIGYYLVSRCPRRALHWQRTRSSHWRRCRPSGALDVARHRRLRAGDRDGRRRQRVGVRACQRGARSGAQLAELGACRVPSSVHSDRRLQRHHIGRSVVAVLLRPPAACVASVSPCRLVRSVPMFTTLVVTRMMIDVSVQSKQMTKSPKVWGMNVGARLRERIERGPNLVARRRIWFMLSALASPQQHSESAYAASSTDWHHRRTTHRIPDRRSRRTRRRPRESRRRRLPPCDRATDRRQPDRCASTNSKQPSNKPSQTP